MEAEILLWIQNNLRCLPLDLFFKGVTHIADPIVTVIFCLLLVALPKTRRFADKIACALAIDLVAVNAVAKNLFKRPRPYNEIPGLINIIEKQSDFSFPSGHTAFCFMFMTVSFLCLPKKYAFPISVLCVLISFSRLYVGVHYPTDVLAGALIGAACGYLGVLLAKYLEKKIQAFKAKKSA